MLLQEDEPIRTFEEEPLPLHWTDVDKLGKSDTLQDTVRCFFSSSSIVSFFWGGVSFPLVCA